MSVPALFPLLRTTLAAVICVLLIAAGITLSAPAARAADQGVGFGTWAPLSAYGWHGSMSVAGVQTYCIVPGLPLPTGPSTDLGVTASAAGLSPQQLSGINQLVTRYGQTSDPVQAAAVGWAVKAIANRAETLHAWGYAGDSLAGAVRWTFERLSPEHADAVAELAEAYYAEAIGVPVLSSDAWIALTTDPSDARKGTVRFDAAGSGTITLTNAVFADTGEPTKAGAAPGIDHAIASAPPNPDGAAYSVTARVEGSVGYAPAVRNITTPGGQDTAGPGGPIIFAAETTDAAPRPVLFTPTLSTQVVEPTIDGGPFVDDVRLAAADGVWPLDDEGAFVSIRATARVYRTEAVVAETDDAPADATSVGELSLMSDPARGPGVYRVTSDWELPGPGVYTAVWQIRADEQDEASAAHMVPGFAWVERFGVATQQITVMTPPPPPQPEVTPTPPAALPGPATPALAATGVDAATWRTAASGAAALLLGCALLAHIAPQRRRPTIDRR